jgi:hypothetical protein
VGLLHLLGQVALLVLIAASGRLADDSRPRV